MLEKEKCRVVICSGGGVHFAEDRVRAKCGNEETKGGEGGSEEFARNVMRMISAFNVDELRKKVDAKDGVLEVKLDGVAVTLRRGEDFFFGLREKLEKK